MSWKDDLAATDNLVAGYFDTDSCRLVPRIAGIGVNHGRQDDASREAFDFLGSLDEQPSGDLMARHRSSDPAAGKANPYYDAVLTALVTGWPWLPRRDDHVVVGGVTWRIMADATDGTARRAWYMNRN